MKYKEVFEKNRSDLDLLETKLRDELSDLRIRARGGPLASPSKIGLVRKDIARVLTAKRVKK